MPRREISEFGALVTVDKRVAHSEQSAAPHLERCALNQAKPISRALVVIAQDHCQVNYAELTFLPTTEEVNVVVNFNTQSYNYLSPDYYYGVQQGDLPTPVRASEYCDTERCLAAL